MYRASQKKKPICCHEKNPSFSVKNPGTRADSPLFLRNLFRSCQRDLKNGFFFCDTSSGFFFFVTPCNSGGYCPTENGSI